MVLLLLLTEPEPRRKPRLQYREKQPDPNALIIFRFAKVLSFAQREPTLEGVSGRGQGCSLTAHSKAVSANGKSPWKLRARQHSDFNPRRSPGHERSEFQ